MTKQRRKLFERIGATSDDDITTHKSLLYGADVTDEPLRMKTQRDGCACARVRWLQLRLDFDSTAVRIKVIVT